MGHPHSGHPRSGQAGHTGHSHTHHHGADLLRAGARHRNRLAVAFAIIAIFLIVEVVAGLMSESLALLERAFGAARRGWRFGMCACVACVTRARTLMAASATTP